VSERIDQNNVSNTVAERWSGRAGSKLTAHNFRFYFLAILEKSSLPSEEIE
jgi:hypothetical protein